MPSPVHAFDVIGKANPSELPLVVGIFGNDSFLRRESLNQLFANAAVEIESSGQYWGEETDWRTVHDELATLSLFGGDGPRVAIVREADKFVTKYKNPVEDWVAKPSEGASLVLSMTALAANTRLYKAISKTGLLIKCALPKKGRSQNVDEKAIVAWASKWISQRHGLNLTKSQIGIMVERCDEEMGMLDIEAAKLVLFADDKGKVTDSVLKENVGGWRTNTMWEISDALAAGDGAMVMEQIDHLIMAGQSPVGLLAQMSWSLRRYSIAANYFDQCERHKRKISLKAALEYAGFRSWDITAGAEKSLKRMGRLRAKQLLNALVELEMQLKGSHSADHAARRALERFVFEMCAA